MQKVLLYESRVWAHICQLHGIRFIQYLIVWGVEPVVTHKTSCRESAGVWLNSMTKDTFSGLWKYCKPACDSPSDSYTLLLLSKQAVTLQTSCMHRQSHST